ncbi:MAG: hypothetical protein JJ964_02385 [Rhizobiales bacterium]|nr:hypothetical protein [Hyphomicrobiales bacterium]
MTNTSPNTEDRTLMISLAVMRLSTAFFLSIWAIDKILNTSRAGKTFSKFYLSVDEGTIILALGCLQLLIIFLFAAGLFKFFSYGAVTLMHTVSVAASYQIYMDPLGRPNILFWAAIPVLAGMIALFLLRDRDRCLTIGK